MHLLFNGRDKGSGKQLKVLTHILYVTVPTHNTSTNIGPEWNAITQRSLFSSYFAEEYFSGILLTFYFEFFSYSFKIQVFENYDEVMRWSHGNVAFIIKSATNSCPLSMIKAVNFQEGRKRLNVEGNQYLLN